MRIKADRLILHGEWHVPDNDDSPGGRDESVERALHAGPPGVRAGLAGQDRAGGVRGREAARPGDADDRGPLRLDQLERVLPPRCALHGDAREGRVPGRGYRRACTWTSSGPAAASRGPSRRAARLGTTRARGCRRTGRPRSPTPGPRRSTKRSARHGRHAARGIGRGTARGNRGRHSRASAGGPSAQADPRWRGAEAAGSGPRGGSPWAEHPRGHRHVGRHRPVAPWLASRARSREPGRGPPSRRRIPPSRPQGSVRPPSRG